MKELILVGNPNTGKTTFFNNITKSNEHTGNWHGVTVDSKSKIYKYKNTNFKVCDLPGIYSLSPLTFEEEVSVNYLYGKNQNSVIINILDINNLNRNLYLTLELVSLNLPLVLVINKMQKCSYVQEKKIKDLEENLGIKIFVIDVKNIKDIDDFKEYIFKLKKDELLKNNKKMFDLSEKLQKYIKKVQNLVEYDAKNIDLDKMYIYQKCLENDDLIIGKLKLSEKKKEKLDNVLSEIKLEEIISEKYNYIDKLLCSNGLKDAKSKSVYGKSALDKIVLNRYLCLPVFALVLLAVFYLTFFSIGSFFSECLHFFVQNNLGNWILSTIKGFTSNEVIIDFFETAIIGGLGSVFSFLPQVIILFLCLGILEESGYLSRVAFSLNDIFTKVGLNGKSVYTLLMGFGCSTSACMTARAVDDKNLKIKTAMLSPYMSCSAKLPIYTILGSAFFGASNVFVIFLMYMLGVVVALLLSVFYEKHFLKSEPTHFILEFPKYRKTSLNRLVQIGFDAFKQFTVRIGSVLFSVNIIVWVLSSFSFGFSFVKVSGESSILEVLSKVITPIFAPLGFGNWGATSALLTGLIAKEMIVSTIAMINGVGITGEDYMLNISKSLTLPQSVISFSPASTLSFMVFCLLYSPCLSTISVLKKEIGKKWLLISILVQFLVAYVISLIVYSSVTIILNKGILTFLMFILVFSLVVFSVLNVSKMVKNKKSCNKCKKCKR